MIEFRTEEQRNVACSTNKWKMPMYQIWNAKRGQAVQQIMGQH